MGGFRFRESKFEFEFGTPGVVDPPPLPGPPDVPSDRCCEETDGWWVRVRVSVRVRVKLLGLVGWYMVPTYFWM